MYTLPNPPEVILKEYLMYGFDEFATASFVHLDKLYSCTYPMLTKHTLANIFLLLCISLNGIMLNIVPPP